MIKKALQLMILIYKKGISPFLPPACRFYPTCSEYAYEAIEVHGPVYGIYAALRRILRCQPFHPGGYDPVVTGKEKSEPKERLQEIL